MSKSNIEEIRSDAQSRFSCVKLVTSELVLTIYNARALYSKFSCVYNNGNTPHISVNKMFQVKKE